MYLYKVAHVMRFQCFLFEILGKLNHSILGGLESPRTGKNGTKIIGELVKMECMLAANL